MDSFSDNSGVIIIAATNRPDVLDPALLRPGRFDRQITVSLPDMKGREEILKVHSRNKKVAKEVNLKNIAMRTPGFSGAELENIMNEAAILAARFNKKEIDMTDIDEAIDRVHGGLAKKSQNRSAEETRIVAYHEAGHALAGLKLKNAMKVQKVTIIPRGDAGGYVLMTPENDKYNYTKRELMDRISGLLAGRVAEELFFDDITTGASSDIEQSTRLARRMVTEFGMSNLGPIKYEEPAGNAFLGRDYANAHRNVSSEVAFEIDQEIKNIINTAYETVKKVILDNRDQLILIAETLLTKEILTNEEVVSLVETGSLPTKEEPKTEGTEYSSEGNVEVKEEPKE
jgi:cell division protease FtsH